MLFSQWLFLSLFHHLEEVCKIFPPSGGKLLDYLKISHFDPEMVTLVTALFDLSKRESVRWRTLDDYLHLCRFTLSLKYPLVIYCDPELIQMEHSVLQEDSSEEVLRT
jgi:hypothetical protein